MNTEFINNNSLVQLGPEEVMNTSGGSFGYDFGVALRIFGLSIGGVANTYYAAMEAARIQLLNSE